MLGAQEERHPWAESPETDRTPTLATAPEGLSARRVERWLDLPPGAWQRRHLYALRLAGQSFSHLGFRPYDLVVVEPGAKAQPGTIVVTRSRDGLSLKRIASSLRGEQRLPTVLELPLRERGASNGEHVVGTVLGLLRPTGTGALRPVAMASGKPPVRRRGAAGSAVTHLPPLRARLGEKASGAARDVDPEKVLSDWKNWCAGKTAAGHVDDSELDRWERLEASLSTLCACLSRTHGAELRSALLAEAGSTIATIHREMCG
jgi:hypothetical protein